MLEGVRGRRTGTAIFIAIIFAILMTLAQRSGEEQVRQAQQQGLAPLAVSIDSASFAD